MCLNDCSFQGECNKETGKCSCNDGFLGPDCSVFEIKFNFDWQISNLYLKFINY